MEAEVSRNADAEEYLTVAELAERIKFSRQTLYNMISTQKFVLNVHYNKPTRRKVVFIWSAVRKWMENGGDADETCGDVGEPVSKIKI